MVAGRRRSLIKQYRDPADAHACPPPVASPRLRSSGRIVAILLFMLVPLAAVAAFMALGASRQKPDPGASNPPERASFEERTSGLAPPSPSAQTSPPMPPPAAVGSGPDPSGPGEGAAGSKLQRDARLEPQATAAVPTSPSPASSEAGEPARTDMLAQAPGAAASSVTPSPSASRAPPGAARGVTEGEIRFGISAPFSGPSRELGRHMRLGIETAFNLANEAGGVHGRQLKLITSDDGYEPTRTAQAMKQLHDEHQVFGVIGNVGTPTAEVALPYALQNRMLFFGAFTGANLLRTNPPDRYVFNYRPSYAEETEAVVRHLVRVRGIKPTEIAVFAQQDAFGDSGFTGAAKVLRALQGRDVKPVLRLNYQRNSVDVADAVTRLRAANPAIKAVVMVATYRAAAKFIERTRALYPQMIYTNVSFVGSTALRDELMLLGPKFAEGVVVTQVVPPIDGHSRVVLDYKAALGRFFPGEAPDYVSLEGYVNALILIEALRRAGPQLDIEKLVDTLEGMKGLDLGLGAPINFSSSDHQGSRLIWGTQLDNTGRYRAIDLE